MKPLVLSLILSIGLAAESSYAQTARTQAEIPAHAAKIDQQIQAFRVGPADVMAAMIRQVTSQSWLNDAWVNSVRSTYEYDGELQTVFLFETWESNAWQNSSRTLSTYENDRSVMTTYEEWSGTAWQPDLRDHYTYSGDDLTEIVTEEYVNGNWVNFERSIITANGDEIITTENQAWDGQAWQPVDRFEFTQEGGDLQYISQTWNESDWENESRTIYPGLTLEELYDLFRSLPDDGFGSSSLIRFPDTVNQEWDGTQWVNVSRQVSEFDANDRKTHVTFENWEDEAWVGSARYVPTYGSGDRIEQLEIQSFDQDWTTNVVESYEYNDDGLLARILQQIDFGTGLTNAGQTLFDWTGTSTAIGTDEVPAGITLDPLYPNPFNPQTTIRYHLDASGQARIQVFDVAGRHIATLADGIQPAGDHEVVFDATGLPSGMYLVRLVTPSTTLARTVTLLR